MAKFNLVDTSNPKVWDESVKEFVPVYATTNTPDRQENNQYYNSHSTGAKREKLNSPRYDYMPSRIVNDHYAAIAEHGAIKYAPDNWKQGLPHSQLTASLQRHLWAYMDGEDLDADSGLPHVSHVLWNAVALVYGYEMNLEDDRFENRLNSKK